MRPELPSAIDAERAIVGAILLKPEALLDTVGVVQVADFHHPAIGAIYAAMVALDAATKPIDALTVATQMRADGSFEKLRGHGREALLGELMSEVVTAENVRYYARLVADAATARRAIEAAREIVAAGHRGESGPELLARAESSFLGIGAAQSDAAPKAAREVLRSLPDRIEERRRAGGLTGIRSGFPGLDVMLGGLVQKRTLVLGARPKMGKTSLVGHLLAHAAADENVPALGISLEVGRDDLLERMAAQRGRVNALRLASGQLTRAEGIGLLRASSELASAPLWITDRARTLAQIRSEVRRWRMRDGAGKKALVVVDYLQRVQHDAGKSANRDTVVTAISNGLCSLAVEADVALVVVVSLNRECEKRTDKRPEPSDIRDSGSIESDADCVSFLYRDAVYQESADPAAAEWLVRLNRFGPTGTVRLRWTGEETRFDPA